MVINPAASTSKELSERIEEFRGELNENSDKYHSYDEIVAEIEALRDEWSATTGVDHDITEAFELYKEARTTW